MPRLKGTPVCDAGSKSTVVMYSWFQVARSALKVYKSKGAMTKAIGKSRLSGSCCARCCCPPHANGHVRHAPGRYTRVSLYDGSVAVRSRQ